MKSLILYNWEVRDEWFKALSGLSFEEFVKEQNAGVETILRTLLHIIDVEYSWFRAINNKPDITINFDDFTKLQSIIELSNQSRNELKEYLIQWTVENENEIVKPSWMTETFMKGEIIRHLIAHEIHHIGQISVWARELGITPINSNFIGRDIEEKVKNL
ncbi:DinB family protein [Cohnella mopanensis]|uniref:DinB family protein n=1 Tax=Cohnella mopanensis TaxID=2911966 RepID=UPI001EF77A33|nr:DinB family protein [Cohnella mopanensis]